MIQAKAKIPQPRNNYCGWVILLMKNMIINSGSVVNQARFTGCVVAKNMLMIARYWQKLNNGL